MKLEGKKRKKGEPISRWEKLKEQDGFDQKGRY